MSILFLPIQERLIKYYIIWRMRKLATILLNLIGNTAKRQRNGLVEKIYNIYSKHTLSKTFNTNFECGPLLHLSP